MATEEVTQKEIAVARDALESHVIQVKKALESLTMLARGDVSITQFRDLRAALGGFAKGKKAVELGRNIVRRRLRDELNDSTVPSDEE